MTEEPDSDPLEVVFRTVGVALVMIRALILVVFLLAGVVLFLFIVWLEQISPNDARAVVSAFLSSTAGKWTAVLYGLLGLSLFTAITITRYFWRFWRWGFKWGAAYLLVRRRKRSG